MKFERELYYLTGLLLGLIFFVFPIIGWDFSYFFGDLADGRLNLFFLEHNYQYLTNKIDTYWDIPFMYPEKNVLAYSDNLMGTSPIYVLFRLIGLDTFSSYLWWFIVLCCLNYSTAFYALKKILKNNQAALIGAFIFAFSIALQSQTTHAQTFPRFAIPLIFLSAFQFAKTLHPKHLLFSLLWLVYQIYCGVYLGFLCAVPLGIYLAIILLKMLFSRPKIKIKHWIWKALLSLTVSLLALLPLMLPYFERKKDPSAEHFTKIIGSIPTLQSYVFSPINSRFWHFLAPDLNIDNSWAHQIFPGIIALLGGIGIALLLLIELKKAKLNINQLSHSSLLVLSGLITFFIFLRWDSYSAYQLFYYLPGFSSMRLLSRIINIELFFFGLATAVLWGKLFQNKAIGNVIFPVLLIFLVLDNSFDGEKTAKESIKVAKKRTATLEIALDKIPKNQVFSFEPQQLTSPPVLYNIDAMLMAQKHNLKTINAYTATCPGDYSTFWNNLNEEGRNYWLAGKNPDQKDLYIVNHQGEINLVNMKEIANQLTSFEKRVIMWKNYIRTDENWFKVIKQSALEKNISIDSALYENAKYTVEMEDLNR